VPAARKTAEAKIDARKLKPFSPEQEWEELLAYSRFLVAERARVAAELEKCRASGQPWLTPSEEYSFPSVVLAAYAREFKEALRPLLPAGVKADADSSPAAPEFTRLGSAHDGGYVMLDPGLGGIAYSLGIDANVDWDLGMAARGFEIFQYDGSIAGPPVNHERFHFEKLFICGKPAPPPGYTTLSSLLARNGHTAKNSLILKMDIEGSEWEVLEALSRAELLQFRQILLELHLRAENIMRLPQFSRILRRLNSTHQPVHVHLNNNNREVDYNGERFWYVYEVSYARKADFIFAPNRESCPAELDAPCNPARLDFKHDLLGETTREDCEPSNPVTIAAGPINL
jgi:hypothetical protein